MSYEPTLLIKKSDLEKNRRHIEERYNTIDSSDKEIDHAYECLYKVLDSTPVVFPELTIVILDVELTSRNQNVRDLLHELEIEYRTHN